MASARVQHVERPSRIPVPGGKLIEEFVGRVATASEAMSVAHMVAPAGWSEPAQTPRFAETTAVVRGRLEVETGDGRLVVAAGQAILVPAGVTVRYGNPFADECEYWAICVPAFSIELAGREDG